MEFLIIFGFFCGWVVGYIQEHYRQDKVKNLIAEIEKTKHEYLVYRGSGFDKDINELVWAKDDAMAYAEGMDAAIDVINKTWGK